MRFPYLRRPSTQFVHALGGWWRDYPMADVGVGFGGRFQIHTAKLDIGSDDTVFPESLAFFLGIDLTNAPPGQAQGVSGLPIAVRFVPVQLRPSDGVEEAERSALVGFDSIHSRRGLLGQTGFHQFFDVTYRGEARETVVLPTPSFPGVYRRR